MWPFSSRSAHLPDDKQEALRKRLRGERKAYQSCLKANGGDARPCRQLEVLGPSANVTDACHWFCMSNEAKRAALAKWTLHIAYDGTWHACVLCFRRLNFAGRRSFTDHFHAKARRFPQCMQVRLLERYSELVCPEAAAAYQACYGASLSRGDTVLDSCDAQVGAF